MFPDMKTTFVPNRRSVPTFNPAVPVALVFPKVHRGPLQLRRFWRELDPGVKWLFGAITGIHVTLFVTAKVTQQIYGF